MNSVDERMRDLRAVLTETLPYELPLGFTNDNLFLSELRLDRLPDGQRQAIEKLRHRNSDYTRPFQYKINRTLRSKNTISIIHPSVQIRIAKLYSDFENTILQACSRSGFSLRRPASNLRIHVKGSTANVRKRWSLGLPDQPFGKKISEAYSPSYFSYQKYLLLDRFFNSNELVRLESRFSHMRTLDISKCFFNIYTHSICWAQKDKDFSKRNAKRFSFEQQFDEVMQKANYNETAGILVGPEASRVFAEIILQKVDVEVDRLATERDLVSEKDYVIRRYVDDYFIFTNSLDTTDALQDLLSEVLEEYKLFLNTDKQEDLDRPFVTSVSRVKYDVGHICSGLVEALSSPIDVNPDNSEGRINAIKIGRASLDHLRHLGGSERGAFISSFSDVFFALQKSIKSLDTVSSQSDLPEAALDELLGRLKLCIRILFYLVSVDFRVPPLIRAAFQISEIVKLSHRLPTSQRQSTLAYIAYEISEILETNYRGKDRQVSLEILCVFQLGLMVDARSFCAQESVKEMIENILCGQKHKGYFAILCGLHYLCSLGVSAENFEDIEAEVGRREKFCRDIETHITSDSFDVAVNCEDYLIFCDYLSCPAPDHNRRWLTFNKRLGGAGLSKADFDEVMLQIRHTNWKAQGTEFGMLVKRLQPVYFSA